MVVYDSVYGNTERIASALVTGLESNGVDVGLVKVDAVRFDQLDEVDLLCIGSPVHSWSASKPVKEFLERLKSVEGLSGKTAFAFDTKLKSRLAGTARGKIEKN